VVIAKANMGATDLPPKARIGKDPTFLADKWFRLALRSLIRSYRAYQPVRFEGRLLQPGKRDYEERWKFISREIEDCRARSFLDIGCAEGYFTQRAARELGCFSLGIEADVRRLIVAQNVNTLERNALAGFMYAEVDLDSLSRLPKFDVVVFLSVLHHFMRLQGSDYCQEVLKIVRSKTNKVMIFEMGVESELVDWTTDVRDMEGQPSGKIAAFLRSAGFSQVDLIGHSTARRDRVRRPMFRAIP
jgi:SAM-dependent methyltransferase